jgi:hypothetical protein
MNILTQNIVSSLSLGNVYVILETGTLKLNWYNSQGTMKIHHRSYIQTCSYKLSVLLILFQMPTSHGSAVVLTDYVKVSR